MSFKKVIAVLFMVSSLPAWASVPYTFTNGQPADATQLNANFSTLVSQIAQLQAQLAALQPAAASTSIVGTWDVVEMDDLIKQPGSTDFSVSHTISRGSLTFTSNGAYTGSITYSGNYVDVGVSSSSISDPPYVTAGPYSYVNFSLSPSSGVNSISGTYTVSGNSVTMSGGGATLQGNISNDGKVAIFTITSDSTGLVIAVKR